MFKSAPVDISSPGGEVFLTRKEASRYVKLGESTLAKMSPPAIKVGRSVRYLRSDLDQWMLARRLGSVERA